MPMVNYTVKVRADVDVEPTEGAQQLESNIMMTFAGAQRAQVIAIEVKEGED